MKTSEILVTFEVKQLALKCIVREQRRFNSLQYFYETGLRDGGHQYSENFVIINIII